MFSSNAQGLSGFSAAVSICKESSNAFTQFLAALALRCFPCTAHVKVPVTSILKNLVRLDNVLSLCIGRDRRAHV